MLRHFSPVFMQKNVYGASVIIFEGIMSFADKELLQVRLWRFGLREFSVW